MRRASPGASIIQHESRADRHLPEGIRLILVLWYAGQPGWTADYAAMMDFGA